MDKINTPRPTSTSISAEEKVTKDEKQVLHNSKNIALDSGKAFEKVEQKDKNNDQSTAAIEAKLKREMDAIFSDIKNPKDNSKVLIKISDAQLASTLGATKPLPAPPLKIKNTVKPKPLPKPPQQSKTQAQPSPKQTVVSPRAKPLPSPPVLKNKQTTPVNNTPVMFNPLGIGEVIKNMKLFKQAIEGDSELASEIANNLNQCSNRQSVTPHACLSFARFGASTWKDAQNLKPEVRKEVMSFASSWIDLKISQGSMGAHGAVWDQAVTQLAIEVKNNWKN